MTSAALLSNAVRATATALIFLTTSLLKKNFSRFYCHIVRNFSWELRKHPQQLFTFLGFNLNRLKFYPGDAAGEALGRINTLYYPQINDAGVANKLFDGRLKAKDIKEPADQRSLTLEEFNLDDIELTSCKDTLLRVAAVSPEIQTVEYTGSFFFYSEPELRDYPGPTLTEFFKALEDTLTEETAKERSREKTVCSEPRFIYTTPAARRNEPESLDLPENGKPDALFHVGHDGAVSLRPFYVISNSPLAAKLKAPQAHIFRKTLPLMPTQRVLVSHSACDVAPKEYDQYIKERPFRSARYRPAFTLKYYHLEYKNRSGTKVERQDLCASSLFELLNFTPETEKALDDDFKVLLALKEAALKLLEKQACVPTAYKHSCVETVNNYGIERRVHNTYAGFAWIPALSDENVRELTERCGALARAYHLHQRARSGGFPSYLYTADNLKLGTAFLSLFLCDFMHCLYPKVLQRLGLTSFRDGLLHHLFRSWQYSSVDFPELPEDRGDEQRGVRQLPYFLETMTGLTLFDPHFWPTLILDDYTLDDAEDAEDAVGAGAANAAADLESSAPSPDGTAPDQGAPTEKAGEPERHLDVTLLFEDRSPAAQRGSYATLSDFKEEHEPDSCVQHLNTLHALGEICPVLREVLKNPQGAASFEGEAAAQALAQLRELKSIGISSLMSRGLHSILRPRRTLSLNFSHMEDSGGGFASLLSYLDYDASVTLGDLTVTKEDYAELLKSAGRIVTFKDRLVLVDARDLSMMEEVFSGKKRKKKKLSLPSVLAAMFGDGESVTPEGDRICFSPKIKAAVNKLKENKAIALPQGLKAKLRPYQVKGYEWLMHNLKNGLGAVVADDMGLGKTVQVLTALLKLKEEGKLDKQSALVVMPASLLINWQHEISAFTPSLTCRIVYSGADEVTEHRDIWLTTYAYFTRHTEIFKEENFRVLVVDEAQNIKNHRTQAAQALRSLNAVSAIAMTGTPVENHLTDYWSIMDLVNPGLLGPLEDFRSDYVLPIEKHHDEEAAKILREAVTPFVLRRLKTDRSIIPDLPEKMIAVQYCFLTPKQSALYEARCSEALRKYAEKLTVAQRLFAVHHAILNLKQICDAPAVYDSSVRSVKVEDSGKAMALMDILANVRDKGQKAIIFTQFLKMGELLQHFIEKATGRRPDFLQGSLKPAERQRMIDDFQNDPERSVLILSMNYRLLT